MAWLDDRIWCHPKFLGLSDAAFATYCKGLAYSSGWGTGGHLNADQQRVIGCTTKTRDELVTAGVWDWTDAAGSVQIHDWDDHNGRRDERRRKDKERKRAARSAGNGAD
jgi:hypothetical protein